MKPLKMTKIAVIAKRGLVRLKKYSPEILLVSGLFSGAAALYYTYKATKVQVVNDEDFNNKKEEIIAKHEDDPNPVKAKEEIKAELKPHLRHYIKDTARTFAKPAGLAVVSAACILGSFGTLKKQNGMLLASVKAFESFVNPKELPEPDENHDEEVISSDNPPNRETQLKNYRPGYSPYARIFEEGSSVRWSKIPGMNQSLILQAQDYGTNLLRAQGHLFLNEMYDYLGFPRTPEGAVCGWLMGYGDDYVDFGLYDHNPKTKEFLSGNNDAVLLDFNVAGVIWDKI